MKSAQFVGCLMYSNIFPSQIPSIGAGTVVKIVRVVVAASVLVVLSGSVRVVLSGCGDEVKV